MAHERNIERDILPEPDAKPKNVELNLQWSDFQFKSKWKYSRLAASPPHLWPFSALGIGPTRCGVTTERKKVTPAPNFINLLQKQHQTQTEQSEALLPSELAVWRKSSADTDLGSMQQLYTYKCFNCWHSHVVNHTVGCILVCHSLLLIYRPLLICRASHFANWLIIQTT